MKAIQMDFLRVVDPRQCGLLDLLVQHDVVTDTDIESVSGKDVYIRKDKVSRYNLNV
jgi:hypothetical protein